MPVYAYKGFNAQGRAVTGSRDADNPRVIKQQLKREGIFLTDLTESGQRLQNRSLSIRPKLFREHVSTQELATATRQLATLLGAGIPLVESLIAIIDQVEHQVFRSIWADVKQKVNEGASFADALASHPKVFSPLYINMVRAGETSGALEVVLSRLADFTESSAELRGKLIGAMIYPVIMMFIALGVVSILFIFVIPKISALFTAQKVALPIPTQILIFISSTARDYWFVIIPAFIFSLWAFYRYIHTPIGRARWDKFSLKAPIFGVLTRMVAVARFSRTLGTLLGAGVPLLAAFDIVKNVVQNSVLLTVIETARDAVKEGDSIAAPLKRSGEFPPIVTHMIAIGERSGQLELMLNNVAHTYEVQIDIRVRTLTSVLEPIMIVFLGVVVGFIVFAILLPILQISSFAG
ncbi:MAG: type II secretion system inner membrane protein GspF [Deltaproteobacteria bacterium]|nr:type II secretion system inner membrane protein GspF [Deltaproteobacteria bacterium]